MKVTVCFGDVRVVVPCGDGGILVRDLIREATLRYKKAVGKSPDAWVPVHSLQSAGGGILDPDDRLSDVADDRERIVASFGAADPPHHHGDGASGSSVGTGSPDIFHDGDKYAPYPSHRTDIEVTGEQIASGVPTLQVRRGSEPSLSQISPSPDGGPPAPPERSKRWSAAPLVADSPPGGRASPDWPEVGDGGGFRRGARDGGARLSMQFLGDGAGYRWAEAAERATTTRPHGSTSLPRDTRRKEPLGQDNSLASSLPSQSNEAGELIIIRNQPGPLGIHVVPDYDGSGKDRGLLVQGIEPGGRIDRDGRLAIFDRIVEINGQNLVNLPFQRVQEMFKLSLTSPELRLRVIKNAGLDSLRKPPAPIYPHPHQHQEDKENAMVECEQKPYVAESTNTKVATVSPTKKVPAISKNLKGLLTANTRKIGKKIEIELVKGPRGLGFSITTRDNPAGGNCPIYIKNIIPEGAAVEDGRLRIGDRLLQVNDEEMTGKTQAEAVSVLRKATPGSKVKIVVSRQEDLPENGLPRVIGVDQIEEKETENRSDDVPPNIPPLPQSHLQALQNIRTPDRGGSVAKIISQFQGQANITHPPDKIDSSMVFPWKHREILTFNIPVHDSEKAGLGISVKGKTSDSGDLGIFIKSVINGGAASRDKRLKPNDQLLNVNGISLLQQSNSDAMETLRKAMLHTEGPVPGNITLTIARRAASPNPSRNGQNRSTESLLNTSNHTEIFGSNSSQENSQESSVENSNSNASGGSTNTVIYNPSGLPNNQVSPMHTWNPVLERLTGNSKPHQPQLRNESYYKATHDTWSNSMLGNSSFGNLTTTTVNLPTAEPILIEDEYGSRVFQHQNPQINVHMMNKPSFSNGNIPENRKDHEPDGKANNNCDKSNEISSSQSTIQNTDATYASQLSLENPQGFSRDAFGRQSMSEKRHATLDAKNTDTYQKTKKMREERVKGKEPNLVRVGSVESVISINRSSVDHPEYADKLGQLGPKLGMKKSSSLESLQTMVQEIQMKEERDPAYSYRGPNGALKVIRGIGCEKSFRDAVVDPNHQSENGAKKHWLLDGPMEEHEIDGFNNIRGAPRQSSLNAAMDKNKTGKKKPGLFKGIGSMFRFGKHRKMEVAEPTQHYHPTNEFDSNANVQPQESDNQNDNQNQQNQNDRLQKPEQQHQQQPNQHQQNLAHQHQQQNLQQHHQNLHQQQLQQLQREQQIQREPIYQRHGFIHRHAEQVQVIPENTVVPPLKYRQNQEQRREMHRQKMMQRHTYYQPEDRETIYEQHRQHQRAEPRESYGEYGRPGSRSGITEPVPFTHYVNYSELQTHLSRKDPLSDSQIVQMRLQVQQQRLKVEEESRKQHQYHSQRQTRPDNQLRPISNYYEYESVQSVLNRGRPNVPVHVNTQQAPQIYQDVNSNSLPRSQQQQPQGRHPAGRNAQHRGPFVTQVTIGDHQKNGTKV